MALVYSCSWKKKKAASTAVSSRKKPLLSEGIFDFLLAIYLLTLTFVRIQTLLADWKAKKPSGNGSMGMENECAHRNYCNLESDHRQVISLLSGFSKQLDRIEEDGVFDYIFFK